MSTGDAATPPVSAGYATVNGARLFYEVAGEGPAVVLLHAGIADRRMWDAQFDAFARRYRTIRYDARGYGRSDFPPGPFARHEDLAGLLRHLGVEHAALVGCSMGGATALDLALTESDLVAALVLLNSGLGGWQWSAALDAYNEEEGAAIARGDIEGAVEANMRAWVDGPQRTPEQTDAAVRAAIAAMLRDASTDEPGEPRRLDPPASVRLAEIRAPTLVVVADADVADILAIGERLTSHIPGARTATIAGAAHIANMEQPEAFNRLALPFLDELPRW